MDIQGIRAAALTIRALSMDAIQKANSGHPGLPLGCAELGALLYGEILKHDPEDPSWIDRDRFVLSAGHGSMFLYSVLHLSGYDISLDDIKTFRQVGSRCAGHPEYRLAPGVEMTTGPLGQGLATAVGMAVAERMLAARYNTEKNTIIDHYTFVLVGDGCMMEGITSEASSFAGHQKLGKLIVFYDSNEITIDGSTDLAFSENVGKRYEAYGWQVLYGDMYDLEGNVKLVNQAKTEQEKPSLIILKSIIGKGSPNKQGTNDIHGAPLGSEEIKAARAILGIPAETDFFVHPDAVSYFKTRKKAQLSSHETWKAKFAEWAKENPSLKGAFDASFHPIDLSQIADPVFSVGDKIASRSASKMMIHAITKACTILVGGSADLSGPNATAFTEGGSFSATNPSGRMINFGIREHSMAAISNGIALMGGLRPFCATFLVFSDYLRPSLRLSALMGLPVIYIFTHDSIFVGEDGPTHEPIEHLAALRAVPNLLILRPGDAQETIEAWKMALAHIEGPVVIALSRQNIVVFPKDDPDWKETIKYGAYVVKNTKGIPDIIIVATGSEVGLAIAAAEAIPDKKIQVVSMISKEMFERQDTRIRETIIPRNVRVVTVEAGVSQGWEGIASSQEDIFSIDQFGESGPYEKVGLHLGFTVQRLLEKLKK